MKHLNMKFFCFLLGLLVLLCVPQCLQSQTTKEKLTGFVAYYGHLNSLKASLHLTVNGSTSDSGGITLNGVPMLRRRGGEAIEGTISPYQMKIGNVIKLTWGRKVQCIKPPCPPIVVLLGRYKVDNIIKWIYPKPNSKINLCNINKTYIQFKWNFTGPIIKSKLEIKDRTTKTTVFQKVITSEVIRLRPSILENGKKYALFLWAVEPMGLFKLSESLASDSKVKFFYSDRVLFETKKCR